MRCDIKLGIEFKTPPSLSKPSPPITKQSPSSDNLVYSSPLKSDMEKVQRKLDFSPKKLENEPCFLPANILLSIFSFLDRKTLSSISCLSKSILGNYNHLM